MSTTLSGRSMERLQVPAIPVVDLETIRGDGADTKGGNPRELFEAFRDVGFAYVKGHGIPETLIQEAFEWSRKFFALPQFVKDKVPHPPEGWYHRGYSAVGLEKVSQMVFDKDELAEKRKIPDVKESFDLGKEDDTITPNIWPPEADLPGFRDFFVRFYETCYELEVRLLETVAIGLGVEADYLTSCHKEKDNQIRLLHYPSIDAELLESGKAECIGAHSDFGTMTILFQDEIGGLMVEDMHEKGKFVAAPFIPGTVVVNVGDFLMRWSNDQLKSTIHTVRTPPVQRTSTSKVRMTEERFSIPYFIVADRDKIIDCIPSCYGEQRPKKYEPISCSEYIDMRMNALY